MAIAPLAFLGGIAAGSLARGVAAGLTAPFQLAEQTAGAELAGAESEPQELPGSDAVHQQLLETLKQAGIDLTHSFQIELRGGEIKISDHPQADQIQQLIAGNPELKDSLFSLSTQNRLAAAETRFRQFEGALAGADFSPAVDEEESAAHRFTFDSQALRAL